MQKNVLFLELEDSDNCNGGTPIMNKQLIQTALRSSGFCPFCIYHVPGILRDIDGVIPLSSTLGVVPSCELIALSGGNADYFENFSGFHPLTSIDLPMMIAPFVVTI